VLATDPRRSLHLDLRLSPGPATNIKTSPGFYMAGALPEGRDAPGECR
jgi:hypothetical protein